MPGEPVPPSDLEIVLLLVRLNKPDPNDSSTWRVDDRPLTADELKLVRRATAADVFAAMLQARESAEAWGKTQHDTESLVALLGEYATGLDLERVPTDDGLRMILERMPPEVRTRAEELIAMQDAYDVLGPLEED